MNRIPGEVIALLTTYAVGCPIGCGLKPIPGAVLDLLAEDLSAAAEEAALTALVLAAAIAAAIGIEEEEAAT